MPNGYLSNQKFLELAPVGTSFRFNKESSLWVREQRGWVHSRRGNVMGPFDGWEESQGWKINDILYPDQKEAPPWIVQAEMTAANVRDLLELSVDLFSKGLIDLEGMSPHEVYRSWLDTLLNAVELGEKGLSWKDYKDGQRREG